MKYVKKQACELWASVGIIFVQYARICQGGITAVVESSTVWKFSEFNPRDGIVKATPQVHVIVKTIKVKGIPHTIHLQRKTQETPVCAKFSLHYFCILAFLSFLSPKLLLEATNLVLYQLKDSSGNFSVRKDKLEEMLVTTAIYLSSHHLLAAATSFHTRPSLSILAAFYNWSKQQLFQILAFMQIYLAFLLDHLWSTAYEFFFS